MKTTHGVRGVRLALLLVGVMMPALLGASLVQAPQQEPAPAVVSPPPQQPAPPDAPAVPTLSGRELFKDKGCEFCHGAEFRGTEKGPALLGVGRKMTPEQIQHQIHDGGGNMPAFGDALTGEEEASLVKFLGTLKARPAARGKGKRSPAG